MEAVILAGGMGTRLKSVIQGIPKPMAKIGDKPFLEYLLNYLISYGITKVILAIGYKHEVIVSYFGNCYHSCEIIYSLEHEPLGTGGAIKLALEKVKSESVFIINGDTFFQVPLEQMLKFHIDCDARFSIALKPMERFSRYGNVTLQNQKITSFQEKVYQTQGLVNGGIYLTRRDLFDFTGYFYKKFSFEEYLSTILVHREAIYGFVCDNYFIDIGVPEDYKKAQIELMNYN